MKLKHIISALVGLSIISAATFCQANTVNIVNNNDKHGIKDKITIRYVVLAQKTPSSLLIPIKEASTTLAPGAVDPVSFAMGKNWRVLVQALTINGKTIPIIREKCKLIATQDSQPFGTIGIALFNDGHALECDVRGGKE